MQGGTIVVGLQAEPTTLDAQQMTDYNSTRAGRNLFDALLHFTGRHISQDSLEIIIDLNFPKGSHLPRHRSAKRNRDCSGNAFGMGMGDFRR